MAESRFSPFFVFRPWPKCSFCSFLLVRRGGKPIFSVFCPSYPYETRVFAFSAHRRGTKGCFSRFQHFVGRRRASFGVFLCFVGRRRAFFGVFCISSPDDERFSAFSAFRRPTMSVFSRFLHFVGRRRAFFSDFCISKGLDSRFLNRIHVIM